MQSVFSTHFYPLHSSWILDNGADTHVCNRTMVHRFRKTRDAPAGGVLAGDARLKIETFDEVDIEIPAPHGRI